MMLESSVQVSLETCWYTSISTLSCNLSCNWYEGVFVLRSFSLCSLPNFVSKNIYIYTCYYAMPALAMSTRRRYDDPIKHKLWPLLFA